jgi:hypothetical protein
MCLNATDFNIPFGPRYIRSYGTNYFFFAHTKLCIFEMVKKQEGICAVYLSGHVFDFYVEKTQM